MSLLIVSSGKDPKDWITALKNQHPGLNIYVYPEDHDREKVEYALTWKHPRGLFKNYPNLKVIASMGAGVNHIISDPGLPKNVKITKIIDPQLKSDMSAFVLSLVMNHIRNLGYYKEQEVQQNWQPLYYRRIEDVKIGIMGLGALGTAVGKKLEKVGFNVYGWARTSKDVDNITTFAGEEELNEFLENSEILVCLLPLTPQTQTILNQDLFKKLPKKAYIINVARGEHLEENDLLEMIDSGHLSGAALDVFNEEPLPEEHPFWKHQKVRITPHIATITKPELVVSQIIENYERMMDEEPLKNVVEMDRGY